MEISNLGAQGKAKRNEEKLRVRLFYIVFFLGLKWLSSKIQSLLLDREKSLIQR
jgi:hypothetical protein